MTGEHRMLIDGKLTEAEPGATYDNVNPATEDVIGQVADGSPADTARAIQAARRASDEPGWSTDQAFRQRCLRQLHDGLDREREALRPQVVAEVGAPIMLTYAVQQDSCIDDMLWEIDLLDRYEWESDLPVHEFMGMKSARRVVREPVGVVGAATAGDLLFMVKLAKLVPPLAAGQSV